MKQPGNPHATRSPSETPESSGSGRGRQLHAFCSDTGSQAARFFAVHLNLAPVRRIRASKMIAASPTSGNIPPPAHAADRSAGDDLRAAAAGDGQAFQRLYRQHVDRIYGAVYRLAGYDHARAEDLTQE